MKIAEEPYETIQGEGALIGTPILVIRMSGCQFRCDYCDTKFSWNDGVEVSEEKIIKIINKSDKQWVMFSGGEPLETPLKIQSITKVIKGASNKYYTVETNGVNHEFDRSLFKLITVSPKTKEDAKYWYSQPDKNISIKVVTDLKGIGMDLLEFSHYLMPLTLFDAKKDLEIKRKVWWYCVKHNIKYSPRIHVDLFGDRRKT